MIVDLTHFGPEEVADNATDPAESENVLTKYPQPEKESFISRRRRRMARMETMVTTRSLKVSRMRMKKTSLDLASQVTVWTRQGTCWAASLRLR